MMHCEAEIKGRHERKVKEPPLMFYLHLQRFQVFLSAMEYINAGTDGCWIRHYVIKTTKGTFKAVDVYFRKVQKHKLNGSKLITVMFDGCFS